MKEICDAISGGVLIGALFGLLSICGAVVVCELIRGWKVWRAQRHVVVMSAVAVLAIIVGGTKPRLLITWDEGLHDAGSHIDTNNLHRVELAWTFDAWIPNVATFTLSAVEQGLGSELFTVATVPITNRALTVMMEREATNYLFFAEQSFIPDAPVVTNGVYHIKCVGGENVWVPVGLKIYGDAELISPPSESFLEDLMKGNLQ